VVEYTNEDIEETIELKEELLSFDIAALSSHNQDSYQDLLWNIDLSLDKAQNFYLYDNHFSTLGGDHVNIPVILVDFPIHDEQDYLDLIALIQDIPNYFTQVTAYTNKQLEQGIMLINYEEVMAYCQNILDNQDDSLLLTALLTKAENIAPDEASKTKYQTQMKQAYYDGFIKGYADLLAYLKEIAQKYPNDVQNIASLPNGKQYYELLIKEQCGNDLTVKALEDLMIELYDENYKIFQDIVTSDLKVLEMFYHDRDTGFASYEAILNSLAKDINQDFPSIDKVDYVVSNIDPMLAQNSILAYYYVSAIDSSLPEQIKVNSFDGSVNIQDISTYLTLAHEGFPGHMYQYVYKKHNMPNTYLKLTSNIAYAEGYAVYSSMEALDYLTMFEQNYIEAYKANELMNYAMINLSDININYYGYTLAQLTDFYVSNGYTVTKDDLVPLYEQLRDDPATFMPYYVGYKQIHDLKVKAQEALKDDFDEKAFNQTILDCGSVPYMIVEKHVEQYILENS
ncbi:MAG: DUF885 domain-containing protein, partial [Erysipelotrichaceae bacterium]|nr:DUF885 domain-containing protein [Erysipelotrichaceae bacterium]